MSLAYADVDPASIGAMSPTIGAADGNFYTMNHSEFADIWKKPGVESFRAFADEKGPHISSDIMNEAADVAPLRNESAQHHISGGIPLLDHTYNAGVDKVAGGVEKTAEALDGMAAAAGEFGRTAAVAGLALGTAAAGSFKAEGEEPEPTVWDNPDLDLSNDNLPMNDMECALDKVKAQGINLAEIFAMHNETKMEMECGEMPYHGLNIAELDHGRSQTMAL